MASPTGKVKMFDLRGMVIPFRNGHPLYIEMTDSEDIFLPIFTSGEEVDRCAKSAPLEYDTLKAIAKPKDFLDLLPMEYAGRKLRLIIDLYQDEEGKSRWSEIQRGEGASTFHLLQPEAKA